MTRLALIGYGKIAPKHLETLRALGAEFVASCNRSEEGRERAKSEGNIPCAYADLGEMLERERPDGVVCCASIMQVHSVAKRLIPSGVPTLLEKPPGTSLAEYRELCALASKHDTPVMVGLNRRYYSVIERAIADAGGLDAISAVFVEWSEDPKHIMSRGFSRDETARMVFGYSLHGVDLLAYLAGALPQAHVTGKSMGEPLRWVMGLQGLSERGVMGSWSSTWDSPGRWRVSFCTPGRRYTFAPLESCEVSEAGVKEGRKIEPDENDRRFKPGFYGQSTAFLEMIASRRPPELASLDAARPGMEIAERLTNACLAG